MWVIICNQKVLKEQQQLTQQLSKRNKINTTEDSAFVRYRAVIACVEEAQDTTPMEVNVWQVVL